MQRILLIETENRTNTKISKYHVLDINSSQDVEKHAKFISELCSIPIDIVGDDINNVLNKGHASAIYPNPQNIKLRRSAARDRNDASWSESSYKLINTNDHVFAISVAVNKNIFDTIIARNKYDTIKEVNVSNRGLAYIVTDSGTYKVTNYEVVSCCYNANSLTLLASFDTFVNSNEFILSEESKNIIISETRYVWSDKFIEENESTMDRDIISGTFKVCNANANANNKLVYNIKGERLLSLSNEENDHQTIITCTHAELLENMIRIN